LDQQGKRDQAWYVERKDDREHVGGKEVSFFSYWPFLFGESLVTGPLLAFFELLAIVYLFIWLAIQIRDTPNGSGNAADFG
jgi:hypothetical protein